MIDLRKISDHTGLQKQRRIMKYVLIYCKYGKIVLNVDEKELTLSAGDILTITSGQVHCIKESKNAGGFVLEFPLEFFCKDDKDIELIFHNGLFCHFALNEVIAVESKVIEQQLLLIEEELEQQPYQYLTSVHSRIALILIAINRAKINRGDEIWKPDALFLKFLELVRSNFGKNYPLSQFAIMLGTSELKLNELSKLHAGKTALNIIYGLTVSEAKRLLTYENLSIKEVAYKLGFNDPFYFSNFFKKHTKKSPKEFKEKYAL